MEISFQSRRQRRNNLLAAIGLGASAWLLRRVTGSANPFLLYGLVALAAAAAAEALPIPKGPRRLVALLLSWTLGLVVGFAVGSGGETALARNLALLTHTWGWLYVFPLAFLFVRSLRGLGLLLMASPLAYLFGILVALSASR